MTANHYLLGGVALAGAAAMYFYIRRPAVSVQFQGEAPPAPAPAPRAPRLHQPLIDGLAMGLGRTLEGAVLHAL